MSYHYFGSTTILATEEVKRNIQKQVENLEDRLKNEGPSSGLSDEARAISHQIDFVYQRWEFERFWITSNIESSLNLNQRLAAIFAAGRATTQAQRAEAAGALQFVQQQKDPTKYAVSRESTIWGTATAQATKDTSPITSVVAGEGFKFDPFRSAREQKFTPQGVVRNIPYALTGKEGTERPVSLPTDVGAPDPDDPDACSFFDIGCQWDKAKWKILLGIIGITLLTVTVYGIAGGVGRGLIGGLKK